jgi:hypothetical protein
MVGLDHAVLVGRAGERGLLIRDDGSLPVVEAPSEASIADATAPLIDLLGVRPTLLRIAQCSGTHDEPTLNVVELEDIGIEAPTGHRWLPLGDVEPERFEPEDLRPQVAYWLRARLEGPTARRAPWSRPGWFARASDWMTETMAALGRPATEPPELRYLWTISAVLRAPTKDGTMFLKSCAPLFHAEPGLTALIAGRSPAETVAVAAVEPDEGWLLMDDHGGRDLGDQPVETWSSGLTAFGVVQRAWREDPSPLMAAGAPVRTLSALVDGLPAIVGKARSIARVDPADLDAFEDAIPALASTCRRLEAFGPGPTLVHGDLHPWNIVAGSNGPIVYDWSDAAVSHPFLDLPVFIRRAKDPAARRAIRAAYLAPWSDPLPPIELAEAGDLALVAGSIYQVESYLAILESLDPEDRYDMAGAPGSWMRHALAMLRYGIEGGDAADVD